MSICVGNNHKFNSSKMSSDMRVVNSTPRQRRSKEKRNFHEFIVMQFSRNIFCMKGWAIIYMNKKIQRSKLYSVFLSSGSRKYLVSCGRYNSFYLTFALLLQKMKIKHHSLFFSSQFAYFAGMV